MSDILASAAALGCIALLASFIGVDKAFGVLIALGILGFLLALV